jgi:polyadenylate-binding protein
VPEATLYTLFSPFGAITSIRICRDHASRKSLGYAYVNFSTLEEGECAARRSQGHACLPPYPL